MKKLLLSERIKRPPRLLTFETYLREQDHPIPSHPDARDPRIVPLVAFDYGNVMARFRQVKHIGKMMKGAIQEMAKSAKSVQENPYTGQTEIDTETLGELEAYAHSLGVTDIGYTRINTRYIFNGFHLLYPNAIVFTMEMERKKIKEAPSVSSLVEIFRTYHQLGVVVNQIAEFLRERGFNALAQPAIGGDVNFIPVAIDAGLGYSGKNGLLITRANGPRVRLAAVVTDIENLPFAGGNPHLWVSDYCQSCNICVEKCPVDAIYRETQTHADGGPVFVDYKKCAMPFSNDNGCTLCIKHCPFSYADYDTLKHKFEQAQVVA